MEVPLKRISCFGPKIILRGLQTLKVSETFRV